MTIEDAIQHCEEVAKEKEELWRICPASESELFLCDGSKDCTTLANGKDKGCLKRAAEYRQLAEWLKDYKRLLEQEPCRDAISRDDAIRIAEQGQIQGFEWELRNLVALPSVNPQPKTAYWEHSDREHPEDWHCSNCGAIVEKDEQHWHNWYYCYHCGKKMLEPKRGKTEGKEQ